MTEQRDAAPAEIAQETIPGGMVFFQVWWAMAWRQFLWFVVVIVVLAIMAVILGLVLRFTHVDTDASQKISGIFGFVAGVAGSIWAFTMALRQILGKEFSGHKLLFLTTKDRA